MDDCIDKEGSLSWQECGNTGKEHPIEEVPPSKLGDSAPTIAM